MAVAPGTPGPEKLISKLKTRSQNLLLILFGLLFALFVVEAGMRAAGFLLTRLQERENLASLRGRDGYTILCLGESTTVQGNYPRRLEKILNLRAGEEIFSVINTGVPGINTDGLLERLEENLRRYNPDIVVAMMGINDPLGEPPESGWDAVAGGRPFYSGLRVYRLFRSILENIRTPRERVTAGPAADSVPDSAAERIGRRGEDIPITIEEARRSLEEDNFDRGILIAERLLEARPADPELRLLLAVFYREVGRLEESERLCRELLAEAPYPPLDEYSLVLAYARMLRDSRRIGEAREQYEKLFLLRPENTAYYREIADFFFRNGLFREFGELTGLVPLPVDALAEWAEVVAWQHRYDEGVDLCRRVLELDPEHRRARIRLAFFLNMQGGSPEVPELCRGALGGDTLDAAVYCELSRHHYLRGEIEEAGRYLRKAEGLDPGRLDAYIELGAYYKSHRGYEPAAALLQWVVDTAPGIIKAHIHLVEVYFALGEDERARDLARRAALFFPEADQVQGLLGLILEEEGRPDEAGGYFRLAEELRSRQISPMTAENYRRLRLILRDRGIPLVAVQYPMRRLDPLREMLPDAGDVVFVDNERIFQEAVAREGYDAVFTDYFAGDFGHFTPRGAELLAANIADALLRAGLLKSE